MTDLEMTRLCAEAMGYEVREPDLYPVWIVCEQDVRESWSASTGEPVRRYDPLHDDAQAMALVKKFDLSIDTMAARQLGWCVETSHGSNRTINTDLNRAIVECVSKMQQAKS